MLRLVLFRHAKSSWAFPELSDFERPLNDRGRGDAPRMAAQIHSLLGKKPLLLSSPACRAAATARYAADMWKLPEVDIHFHAGLYHASPDALWQLILKQDKTNTTLVIFGHNEGLTELATACSQSTIKHLPTAGVAVFDFDSLDWSQIQQEKAKLTTFTYPKKA